MSNDIGNSNDCPKNFIGGKKFPAGHTSNLLSSRRTFDGCNQPKCSSCAWPVGIPHNRFCSVDVSDNARRSTELPAPAPLDLFV